MKVFNCRSVQGGDIYYCVLKLGQKRCQIRLSILLRNGAKLRTKVTWQKDAEWDKSMSWQIGEKLEEFGAKSDSICNRGRLWGPAPKWMWLQCHQNNRGPSHRRCTNFNAGWRGANCRKKDVFFSVRKKMLITSWSCWGNLSCFSWRRGPRKR